jgi:hypothetical protein
MPAQNLIDVRIIVDGQPLQEYMEPEAIDEGNERVRYVEVKAGQEFSVQVTRMAGFELMWTEALRFTVEIDDLDFYSWAQIEKKDMRHRRGVILHDHFNTVDSSRFKNDITAKWERCPYTFGVLGISECCGFTNNNQETDCGAGDEGPVNSTLKPENIKNLGSIRVQVY